MVIALCMGFASGFPLLLTKTTLKTWLREEGIDLSTIGFFAAAGLPYTLKFLWAPLLDRYAPPILGRRRGWLFLAQACLVLGLAFMASVDPQNQIGLVGFIAFWIAFFSATQDIVVDAYRRETLSDEELGLGSSLYVYGYRVALWVTRTAPLFVAQYWSWQAAYLLMALLMAVNLLVTVLAREPEVEGRTPESLRAAVVEPLVEFFTRSRLRDAVLVLLFILLYKVGDSYASVLTAPFYIDLGFSKAEIGAVDGTVGFFTQIIGLLLGGLTILRIGIMRSLWVFGILQMISTAGFVFLAELGNNTFGLGLVIGFENASSGMGTAAFVAYMASLTDKRFTATQYALLTSLMAVPLNLLGATSGLLAETLGWFNFFLACTLMALPGLVLLYWIAPVTSATTVRRDPAP